MWVCGYPLVVVMSNVHYGMVVLLVWVWCVVCCGHGCVESGSGCGYGYGGSAYGYGYDAGLGMGMMRAWVWCMM